MMQTEGLAIPETESDSPNSTGSGLNNGDVSNGVAQPGSKPAATKPPAIANSTFPPPKTDKPRPHTCNTCGRSFARLEHLKRHERSHTKEKPFECPECNRCFARRDLLLRHQQKLHLTNATTRPRNGRRESVVSVASNGRVRKNSLANIAGVGMPGPRPRANTISHIDAGPLGMFNNMSTDMDRLHALGLTMPPQMGMPHPTQMGFDHRGLPTGMGFQGNMHGLTKLDTQFSDPDPSSNTLRTAPPYTNFGGFDVDQLFSPSTTVNPAALHFGEASPMPQALPFGFEHQTVPDDDFTWVRNWNMQTSQGPEGGEQVLEESSPSRGSSGDSPVDYSESMNNSHAALPPQAGFQWQQHPDAHLAPHMPNGAPFHLDQLGSGIQNLDVTAHAISPMSMHGQGIGGDGYFHTGMVPQNNVQQQQQQTQQQQHMPMQHDVMQTASMSPFSHPLTHFPSNTSSHASHGAKPNLAATLTSQGINPTSRQVIEATLSPSTAPMHRKYSQANIGSPLTPGGSRNTPSSSSSLPSTEDLVKYVEAFIQFAIVHLPVVHMATLSFKSLDIVETDMSPSGTGLTGVPLGAQCLLLNMAAVGALYEYDYPASKKLYSAAKSMIAMYLDERRKAEVSSRGGDADSGTPMWLVEAMLLTVIYGHHCGDKLASDIANNHIAALVSLSRSAKLSQPPASKPRSAKRTKTDVEMGDGGVSAASKQQSHDLQAQWLEWKDQEERKRIFFGIFVLSSLLTTAYSLTPAIMNSEIQLDLPCDEGLWTAETAEEWQSRGGLAAAEASCIPFSTALSKLLTANQRPGGRFGHGVPYSTSPLTSLQNTTQQDPDFKPSTFGCYILINALHNYIWETRSRHQGREWTLQESEAMVEHIEPALNAWHAAWSANERHRIERPNPFGLGPLSADSRPLLDLAYVRLYVNFSRTLECFYRRDLDGMAGQLRLEGYPPGATAESTRSPTNGANAGMMPNGLGAGDTAPARRERHLRRAALYAADSLTIACRMNLTYADSPAHELPIQSAICFSDGARVLAEWVTTVQERVGRYVGVLGRDPIDFAALPAVVLLAAEDMELLGKIEEICNLLEAKRQQQENLMAMDLETFKPAAPIVDAATGAPLDLTRLCLGSRVLRVVATMLEKAVIWPITGQMARALEVTASHIERRADESLMS